ncbi:hypothetical protein IWW40_005756 [Coemansia sp. RSA 1250]|nr:hypothetical protein IWW40_005756 [Coemansia sp. RSA 1250]
MKLVALSLGLLAAFSDIGNAAPTSASSDSCTRSIAGQIINLFQSGQTGYNFAKCEKDSSGNGYASGIVNFTTRNGDALKVIESYRQSSDYNGEFDEFMDTLKSYAKKGSKSTSGLSGYCDAWEKAADNRSFWSAQDGVAYIEYQEPALNLAKRIGVKMEITQAVMYDTAIMDGPGSSKHSLGGIFDATNAKFNASQPDPDSDNNLLVNNMYQVGEIIWLKEFLKTRESLSESDSSYSIETYNELINSGKYDWSSGEVTVKSSDGDNVTIKCNYLE